MSGKIITCTIRELDKVKADIRLLITRKGAQSKNWIWVPELAPSKILFGLSRQWKEQGLWPQLWPSYETIFKEEMFRDGRDVYIKRVISHLKDGKTLAMGCYCPRTPAYMHEGKLACHRRILAEYFAASGYEVEIM